ncbi:single-stranded DNA-binding protein [Scrofimicrobium sp. R131]|uniref:Single-stranded DNA-binding protein n=1 Tax=Scrofimicrobium appendicitidis TaxID=3079930 RepID=A0AAU7V7P5_9ACTO
MANDTVITVVGNLTADPNLRFTGNGAAVVDFTVASTPRTFDRQSGQWRDGETLFLRCTAWREYAENIADSLSKGMRVIVQGRLTQSSYERDGQKRTSYELQVDEVGPALRYAKAQVTRTPRQDGGGFNQGGGQQGGYAQPAQRPAQAPQQADYSQGGFGAPAGGQAGDPWGTPPGGGSSFDDEPPF